MKFKDTIGIFNNAFSAEECQAIIDGHSYASANGFTSEGGYGTLEGHKKSRDYDIIRSERPEDKELVDLIANKFNRFNMEYLRDFAPYDEFNTDNLLNAQTYYPLFQIQHYLKGLGHFNSFHLENHDVVSSKRLFVFILYLNDVSEGGETAFYFKEDGEDDFFKVKPEVGKLIIHPASWPYVHKGHKPESDDKYILTTWLCYMDNN